MNIAKPSPVEAQQLCRAVAYITDSDAVPSRDSRIDVDIVLDSLQAFELLTVIDPHGEQSELFRQLSGSTLGSLCRQCRGC